MSEPIIVNGEEVEPTWELLCRIEPALAALEALVKQVRSYHETWSAPLFGHVKTLLYPLVGWGRGELPDVAPDPNVESTIITGRPTDTDLDEMLEGRARVIPFGQWLNDDDSRVPAGNDWERLMRTERAWNVAYRHLYGLLPDDTEA